MFHTKAIVMGASAGLLLSASAFAAGTAQEKAAPAAAPATVDAFVKMAPKVALGTAIQDAEKNSPGRLVQIRFIDPYGHATYEAIFVSGSQVVTEDVDPNTGRAGPPRSIPIHSGPAMRQRGLGNEEAALKGLKSPTWSLQEAIDTAQQQVPGRAMDARLTENAGKPVYAIGVVSDGKVRTVDVSPMTGKVAWLYEEGGALAATVEQAPVLDDRIMHALTLLESRGYRDFTSIRPDGRDYDVGVLHGGKTVTLAVDPDTGKIATHV